MDRASCVVRGHKRFSSNPCTSQGVQGKAKRDAYHGVNVKFQDKE